jgi:hypothetical protein
MEKLKEYIHQILGKDLEIKSYQKSMPITYHFSSRITTVNINSCEFIFTANF